MQSCPNKEQIEVFLNQYTSIAQPLLVYLAGDVYEANYIQNVIALVTQTFTIQGQVLTGGLLVLNGLINGVGESVKPYLH